MKSLYEAATAAEVKARLSGLGPESQALWGKMNAGQMLAHCSLTFESAVGERRPPRMLIGRVLGPLVKPGFSNDKPLSRNGPTAPALVVSDTRDVQAERTKLVGLIERFAAGGVAGCTTHPHVFFGKLTPEEWGKGMYKHLDHHLQQFGV